MKLLLCLLLFFPFFASAQTALTLNTEPKAVTKDTKKKTDKPKAANENSNLPIEISADSLEVLQQENKAIFTGNVIAVQGTFRLKADKMIIHYKQKDEDKKPAPTPATNAPATGQDMGNITLIEVEGNVVLTNPEETAQGDKGEYQVATRIIHLTGNNVILTREKNVLRGTALEYNMETGRSVLTNGAKTTSGDKRVRGVFVPKPAEKTGDKAKDKAKDKSSDKPADKANDKTSDTKNDKPTP